METVLTASHSLITPVYGRTRELQTLMRMLRNGTRLVTLRGPGGIGKTALAQHIAHAVQQAGDRVVFVDLATIRDAHQVLDTIAATLPAADRQETALRTIVSALANRPTLLILDNFEQILDAAGDLLELLAAADTVQLLVTSRTVLGLHDEHEYPLEPLSLPASLERLEDSAAVEMFVHRVQAVQPEFQITPENAQEVAALVNALEGVPLAIELAAARLRSYTLTDLVHHLDHPLAFLKADFRDRPERLRSLRATVQWSYDLLGDGDREVFECCAVFEGSFTPEALVAVWRHSAILDRVDALLEHSFLQRQAGSTTRWKMLQPLREHALEKLDARTTHTWRDRHAQYYLTIAVEALEPHAGFHMIAQQYAPDYPNMREGLTWAIEHQQAEVALRYLPGISRIWIPFGLFQEGLRLSQRALALPAPGLDYLRPHALHAVLECLLGLGLYETFTSVARELLEVSQAQGDISEELTGCLAVALGEHWAGRNEDAVRTSHGLIRRCEQLLTVPPEQRPFSVTDGWLRMTIINALNNAVFPLLELGEYEQALHFTEAAEKWARQSGVPDYISCLALVQYHMGLYREAAQTLLSNIHFYLEKEFWAELAAQVKEFGLVLAAQDEPKLAVQFFSFTHRLEHGLTGAVGRYITMLFDRVLAELRQNMGDGAYQQAWQEGAYLTPEEMRRKAEAFVQSLQEQDQRENTAPASGGPGAHTPSHGLTAREVEVLALVAQGHPDRRIAKLLGISPATASKHVANVLGKLGMRNRVELARWAMQHEPG
ncbi:ATP-binding protein [Deinococcus aerophilus]|uniref:HTH luxR-type domain-containing protein n=1 Tax=Deinococcus aerophilus TaxID=522488 RepID=A0ABQ2GYD8_9DEIO|nr:LuxR C-terminal-related transcriptional regulator [Deinococcus aerophilus]GGM18320.1 hypothetical protein GCM10010841_28020 [Deinococcus aerophilus]